MGWFKSARTVSLTTSQEGLVKDAEIMMVDAKEGHKIYDKDFGKDGSAKIKVPAGQYDTYIICDGWSYYYGRYNSDGHTDNAITMDLDKAMTRMLLVEFKDKDGNRLMPKEVTWSGESMEGTEECCCYDGGTYVMVLPNLIGTETLTIYADGYNPVIVSGDWSQNRMAKLEVILNNE